MHNINTWTWEIIGLHTTHTCTTAGRLHDGNVKTDPLTISFLKYLPWKYKFTQFGVMLVICMYVAC